MGNGVPVARLDEKQGGGLRAWWRNASVKTVFVVYVITALAIATALAVCLITVSTELRSRLYMDVWGIQGTYLYDESENLLWPVSDVTLDEGATLFVETHSYLHAIDPANLPKHAVLRDISDYIYASEVVAQSMDADAALESLKRRFPTSDEIAPQDIAAYNAAAVERYDAWAAENADSVYVRLVYESSDVTGELVSPVAYWVDAPLSDSAAALETMLDISTLVAIPLYFVVCIALAARRFYKKRLQPAIGVLESASESIAAEDLDFTVTYDRADELGKLAASFEKMRSSLEKSQRALWRTAEERKRLNAAFSHDLRTPLTVLKGRLELLESKAEVGALDPDEALIMTRSLKAQVDRLERYVAVMGDAQKLDDRELLMQEGRLDELACEVGALASDFAQVEGKDACITMGEGLDVLAKFDRQAVVEVAENLLGNALRFADERVAVHMQLVREQEGAAVFELVVEDDGPGFSAEALHRATEPFYSSARDAEHFGLGLNICALLCEKHGGAVELANRDEGGARVVARFSVELVGA